MGLYVHEAVPPLSEARRGPVFGSSVREAPAVSLSGATPSLQKVGRDTSHLFSPSINATSPSFSLSTSFSSVRKPRPFHPFRAFSRSFFFFFHGFRGASRGANRMKLPS